MCIQGDDYLDQIQRIVAVLGTPTEEDIAYIGNESALKYLNSLPHRPKPNWSALFPKASPQALDLLGKMLAFNPDRRLTVQECLSHPYFEDLRDAAEETTCEKPFDWSWDNFTPTKEILQKMVYDEACKFHPIKKAADKTKKTKK